MDEVCDDEDLPVVSHSGVLHGDGTVAEFEKQNSAGETEDDIGTKRWMIILHLY